MMIRHRVFLGVMIMSSAWLSGCATLSKEECLTGNWQAIGFADGAAGRTPERLAAHNKACAKVGVAPNYQAWEQGRKTGLKQYCTTTNAYQIGRRGAQLNAVCPAETTAELERINADGRQYYSLTKQLAIEEKQLQQYRDEYDALRSGDNLNFSDEREARGYLLELPKKSRVVSQRIDNLKRGIEQLQRQYGY